MNRQRLAFARAASALIGSRRRICFGSAIVHASRQRSLLLFQRKY
jgi:hypothetical protein